MLSFMAGSRKTADQISVSDSIISLDIGFASKERTTGVAIRSAQNSEDILTRKAFGELKDVFKEHIQHSDVHLIIEAPLSMCFDRVGNPMGRSFEQRIEQDIKSSRYWFVSPGTTTMVAAMIFLREIQELLTPTSRKIYVYEGFITFKTKKTKHEEDARLLLEILTKAKLGDILERDDIMPRGAGKLQSIGLYGLALRGIPSVLIPKGQMK